MADELNSSNFDNYSFILPYIRYCAEDRYNHPWELKTRKINDYEFIFMLSGRLQTVIGNEFFEAAPGVLVLFEPGIPHSAKALTYPFSFICVHFDLYVSKPPGTMISDPGLTLDFLPGETMKFTKAAFVFPWYRKPEEPAVLQQLLKRILLERTGKAPGYAAAAKALFLEFIHILLREERGRKQAEIPGDDMLRAAQYIEANHTASVKLTDIAAYVHMQPSYVSYKFRKVMGVTVTQYIKMCRIASARKLLLETSRKTEDIAQSTGFYDLHHFSRTFREIEGITPKHYREMKFK